MTWWRCFTSHEVIESRDSWRTDGHWSGRCPAIGPGTHDAGCGWIDLGRGGPVDGRNPANQLRLVVHPIIYKISQWIVYPSWGLSIVCLSFVSPSILKVFRHLAKWPDFWTMKQMIFHEIRTKYVACCALCSGWELCHWGSLQDGNVSKLGILRNSGNDLFSWGQSAFACFLQLNLRHSCKILGKRPGKWTCIFSVNTYMSFFERKVRH